VALKVLPKQRETDKNELEEKVLLKINQLIFPLLTQRLNASDFCNVGDNNIQKNVQFRRAAQKAPISFAFFAIQYQSFKQPITSPTSNRTSIE
jgi:hypothetical protein